MARMQRWNAGAVQPEEFGSVDEAGKLWRRKRAKNRLTTRGGQRVERESEERTRKRGDMRDPRSSMFRTIQQPSAPPLGRKENPILSPPEPIAGTDAKAKGLPAMGEGWGWCGGGGRGAGNREGCRALDNVVTIPILSGDEVVTIPTLSTNSVCLPD